MVIGSGVISSLPVAYIDQDMSNQVIPEITYQGDVWQGQEVDTPSYVILDPDLIPTED